jgi:primary-amine oxidase
LVSVCKADPKFKQAIAELNIPNYYEIVVEPWPYGGLDEEDESRRYFQGLIFAQDTRNDNPDSNFYAFPLPLIPVLDIHKK